MNEKPRPFVRMIIACLFFFIAVTLNIFLPRYWHTIPEIVKHLLLVFSAIMCVHIMEYAYLWWEIFGHIRNILKETLQATHQLIDDNRNALEKSLQTTNRLIGSAAIIGLKNVYSSRKDVKGDIYDAIENAEKRVWLLGITASENILLDELLSTLNNKLADGLDVRILLLDALRSSAVFRTLLESTAHEAAKIVNADRTDTHLTDDPYFHQRLYSDFTHVCDRLGSYPRISATVRFYTQTPACWMMIVDNSAHFQPYTFGRSANKHSANLCTGANMPVFKFQMQENGRPFEILEDNFQKLWLTSNLDLFHIEARIANRNRIISDVFHDNSQWFKHVYEALYVQKGAMQFTGDRRKFPRQSWDGVQSLLKVCLPNCQTPIKASLCDYSREGAAIKLDALNHSLKMGDIVTLQNTLPSEPRPEDFIIAHFLKRNQFIIRRIINDSQPVIGLQIVSDGERRDEQDHFNGITTASHSLS